MIKAKNRKERSQLKSLSEIEISRLRGSAILELSGVFCVKEISSDLIKLQTKEGLVLVRGKGLRLSLFEGRCIEIFGVIEGVELGNGRA